MDIALLHTAKFNNHNTEFFIKYENNKYSLMVKNHNDIEIELFRTEIIEDIIDLIEDVAFNAIEAKLGRIKWNSL